MALLAFRRLTRRFMALKSSIEEPRLRQESPRRFKTVKPSAGAAFKLRFESPRLLAFKLRLESPRLEVKLRFESSRCLEIKLRLESPRLEFKLRFESVRAVDMVELLLLSSSISVR